jgi:hypothetical protein
MIDYWMLRVFHFYEASPLAMKGYKVWPTSSLAIWLPEFSYVPTPTLTRYIRFERPIRKTRDFHLYRYQEFGGGAIAIYSNAFGLMRRRFTNFRIWDERNDRLSHHQYCCTDWYCQRSLFQITYSKELKPMWSYYIIDYVGGNRFKSSIRVWLL